MQWFLKENEEDGYEGRVRKLGEQNHQMHQWSHG